MIELISKELKSAAISLCSSDKLIVTSKDPTPIQVHLGISTTRGDLTTIHEEADVIIPMQIKAALSEGRSYIGILYADTDVFV